MNGEIELSDIEQAKAIVQFLSDKGILSRYTSLVIADSYFQIFDDEDDDFGEIIFKNGVCLVPSKIKE